VPGLPVERVQSGAEGASLGKAETRKGSTARVLRPTWRKLDREMSGGAHTTRPPIAGEALKRFQNQKKLFSKHGRKPRSELTNDAASGV